MHPFLKGLLVGLAVGAAVGLLITPRKGKENREFVRQRIQQAQEAAKKATQDQEELLRTRFRTKIAGDEKKEPAES